MVFCEEQWDLLGHTTLFPLLVTPVVTKQSLPAKGSYHLNGKLLDIVYLDHSDQDFTLSETLSSFNCLKNGPIIVSSSGSHIVAITEERFKSQGHQINETEWENIWYSLATQIDEAYPLPYIISDSAEFTSSWSTTYVSRNLPNQESFNTLSGSWEDKINQLHVPMSKFIKKDELLIANSARSIIVENESSFSWVPLKSLNGQHNIDSSDEIDRLNSDIFTETNFITKNENNQVDGISQFSDLYKLCSNEKNNSEYYKTSADFLRHDPYRFRSNKIDKYESLNDEVEEARYAAEYINLPEPGVIDFQYITGDFLPSHLTCPPLLKSSAGSYPETVNRGERIHYYTPFNADVIVEIETYSYTKPQLIISRTPLHLNLHTLCGSSIIHLGGAAKVHPLAIARERLNSDPTILLRSNILLQIKDEKFIRHRFDNSTFISASLCATKDSPVYLLGGSGISYADTRTKCLSQWKPRSLQFVGDMGISAVEFSKENPHILATTSTKSNTLYLFDERYPHNPLSTYQLPFVPDCTNFEPSVKKLFWEYENDKDTVHGLILGSTSIVSVSLAEDRKSKKVNILDSSTNDRSHINTSLKDQEFNKNLLKLRHNDESCSESSNNTIITESKKVLNFTPNNVSEIKYDLEPIVKESIMPEFSWIDSDINKQKEMDFFQSQQDSYDLLNEDELLEESFDWDLDENEPEAKENSWWLESSIQQDIMDSNKRDYSEEDFNFSESSSKLRLNNQSQKKSSNYLIKNGYYNQDLDNISKFSTKLTNTKSNSKQSISRSDSNVPIVSDPSINISSKVDSKWDALFHDTINNWSLLKDISIPEFSQPGNVKKTLSHNDLLARAIYDIIHDRSLDTIRTNPPSLHSKLSSVDQSELYYGFLLNILRTNEKIIVPSRREFQYILGRTCNNTVNNVESSDSKIIPGFHRSIPNVKPKTTKKLIESKFETAVRQKSYISQALTLPAIPNLLSMDKYLDSLKQQDELLARKFHIKYGKQRNPRSIVQFLPSINKNEVFTQEMLKQILYRGLPAELNNENICPVAQRKVKWHIGTKEELNPDNRNDGMVGFLLWKCFYSWNAVIPLPNDTQSTKKTTITKSSLKPSLKKLNMKTIIEEESLSPRGKVEADLGGDIFHNCRLKRIKPIDGGMGPREYLDAPSYIITNYGPSEIFLPRSPISALASTTPGHIEMSNRLKSIRGLRGQFYCSGKHILMDGSGYCFALGPRADISIEQPNPKNDWELAEYMSIPRTAFKEDNLTTVRSAIWTNIDYRENKNNKENLNIMNNTNYIENNSLIVDKENNLSVQDRSASNQLDSGYLNETLNSEELIDLNDNINNSADYLLNKSFIERPCIYFNNWCSVESLNEEQLNNSQIKTEECDDIYISKFTPYEAPKLNFPCLPKTDGLTDEEIHVKSATEKAKVSMQYAKQGIVVTPAHVGQLYSQWNPRNLKHTPISYSWHDLFAKKSLNTDCAQIDGSSNSIEFNDSVEIMSPSGTRTKSNINLISKMLIKK